MRPDTSKFDFLRRLLDERLLILDGAMGSQLQCACGKVNSGKLPDLFVRDHPKAVTRIHEEYLKAGADIIETNSFNSNALSLLDYGLEAESYVLSKEAAKLAREAADKYTRLTPGRPRFVAGSVGPTKMMLTLAEEGPLAFDRLADAYEVQIQGLIDGGADIILLETVFDTLNAKAGLYAVSRIEGQTGCKIPVIVSATVDNNGRLLSGQNLEAFYISVSHADLLAIGLNCGLGSADMLPLVKRLSEVADVGVSLYPNAGLPDNCGEYHETHDIFASNLKECLEEKLVNIIGGCCGTTPEHIKDLSEMAERFRPRKIQGKPASLALSNLEPSFIGESEELVQVGERTNVAGSKKFARLVREGNFDEALDIAVNQIKGGAAIIDICMDDALDDARTNMVKFLRLINSGVETGVAPVMIDSSHQEVIEAALKVCQGKSIVNSISLKDGEEEFIKKATKIKRLGAAFVVMLFDEDGQAVTFERKCAIAKRAYDILVREGIKPQDIIFDPNILTVGTGIDCSQNVAKDFILATEWIKSNLAGVSVSGGISNLSFAFRGNNSIREAMHTVFLYHASRAGLDMAIVNAGMLSFYSDIDPELLEILEDVILGRNHSGIDRLVEYASKSSDSCRSDAKDYSLREPASEAEAVERLLLSGRSEELRQKVETMVNETVPFEIIDKYLMPGMRKAGELFGEGKMFLPQVIRSAQAMKAAVEVLKPYIDTSMQSQPASEVLLATVKGDVHDIGKNIVGLVASCNGYGVVDLGVRVDAETIVRKAKEINPEAILLSGLISPSLSEMENVCKELGKRGISIPVIIGGAATSEMHTAVRIAPKYDGPVFYSADAAQNLNILSSLTKDYNETVKKNYARQKELRALYEEGESLLESNKNSRNHAIDLPVRVKDLLPDNLKKKNLNGTALDALEPLIEWKYLLASAGLMKKHGGEKLQFEAEKEKLLRDAERMFRKLKKSESLQLEGVLRIFEAAKKGDGIVLRGANDGNDYVLPMKRAVRGADAGLCLSDFISKEKDYIALFAVSAGKGVKELIDFYNGEGSPYEAFLVKLVADRLTEAFARLVHASVSEIMTGERNETGIRVAFGYPSAPDHGLKKDVFNLLEVEKDTGMRLTETNMIEPGESICGLIMMNGKYINVG